MQTKQQQLAQKLARLDTLETYKRAMIADYMPIKNEMIELKDEIEKLEDELLTISDNETDARFDELIGSLGVEEVKTIEENQLIDEIKNPEDYTNFDTKDLESSQ